MTTKLEICAELSASHLGSYARAHAVCLAAAYAGADLFKVQVWEPDTMCVDRTYTLSSGLWKGRSLFDLYREAYTPWEWLPDLFALARNLGMEPFGAAFDKPSVDYLETLGVKRFKVASFELVDLPLIRYMASKGKPMILSTGMATQDEIKAACDLVDDIDIDISIVPLLCTSAYPAAAADANLATVAKWWRGTWPEAERVWGLSDHTQGIGVACAAAALGATYVEKHLTLSRADGGPDAGFAMEPAEFAQLVTECRRAAAAVGTVAYGPKPGEDVSLRRSYWVVRQVKAGESICPDLNIRTARPALGLSPSVDLTGKRFACDVEAGKPLLQEYIA